MALLGTQRIDRDGLTPTYAAATAGGDTVNTGATTFLHVKNASAAAITVTLVTPGKVGGLDIADQAATCPVGDTLIGPISPDLFGGESGVASITYSAVASVTVAALAV